MYLYSIPETTLIIYGISMCYMMDKTDSKTFFRLIRKNKASSNETAAMVIKGDQNQDVGHKEQADLFAQFYESLAIPSNEEHFDNDHLKDCAYRYSLINKLRHFFKKCIFKKNF
jgi:hypothetical protein